MPQLTITITEEMLAYIDEKVSNGTYTSASEFVCDLLRHEQKREEASKLEDLLIEGLGSGSTGPWTKADSDTLWAELEEFSIEVS